MFMCYGLYMNRFLIYTRQDVLGGNGIAQWLKLAEGEKERK